MKGDESSFPDTNPQLEPPHGRLLSDIEYDIAFFFGQAALLMQTDVSQFLNKIRVYLRFLRLRKTKETHTPSPLEEKATSCLIIHTASPPDLEFHLFSLLSDLEGKELILPVLKEAILVARNDRRFYLPDKNAVEKLLLETAVFDDALEEDQRNSITQAIGHFASLYALLLNDLFAWVLSQPNPSLIHSTLLCASGLKTVYDTLPREEQEPLSFFLRSLSGCIASLNMLQEEYLSKIPASDTLQTQRNKSSPLQESTYQVHCILFLAIRALPIFSPLEDLIATFFIKTPSIQALFYTSSLPYEEKTDVSFLIKAAVWSSLLSLVAPLFCTLYVLQQKRVSKKSFALFLQDASPISSSLLAGFCHLWKRSFRGCERGALLAVITLVCYDALVKCMLCSPSSLPQNPSFWQKKQLSLSSFCEGLLGPLNLPPLCCDVSPFEHWNQEDFSSPNTGAPDDADILFVLQNIPLSFFWPELDSLVKKTVRGVHIKKLADQPTIDTLIETGDLLLQAASSETLSLSFLQLISESAKQVRALHGFVKKKLDLS